jgi:hypothetical protein
MSYQGQGFSSSYEAPNYMKLVILTSFGWDDKPRSSVCTYSEHQVHIIKILQSLYASHKIVETQKPACTKVLKKQNGNDAPMAALTSLISGRDTFWEQARTSAKRPEHLIEWMCAIQMFNQLINQNKL